LKVNEKTDVEGYLSDAREQYEKIRAAFNNLQDKMRESQAPQSAIDAEISRLKASDPAFRAIAQSLEDLNVRKSSLT
jgi:uncharacterized protein YdcH (DUF465 family)